MLITSTVEICIQQLGRVEQMVWLPYDAGLSAAAQTLVGILKRVIVSPAVYPRFLEFLHVDIQSTGRTLSRPWSRQRNDVMSEIECAQLHIELFRCRHSIRQSHGLFALAKRLWLFIVESIVAGSSRTFILCFCLCAGCASHLSCQILKLCRRRFVLLCKGSFCFFALRRCWPWCIDNSD